jgi:hypothetical protein
MPVAVAAVLLEVGLLAQVVQALEEMVATVPQRVLRHLRQIEVLAVVVVVTQRQVGVQAVREVAASSS